ncbi:glycosyltransferase family 4 protein [Hymenobacter sp. PAMC 26628]|uniref:glycosyltransferase family 4 protein n=1 Tax=Hymenobacter sp. PAMC 26628 TaxID=1484118 RepID=UPI0012FFAA39|nr:glycosyltransferase family 4 protein [Hymenobacter sp. PAMC 26628]
MKRKLIVITSEDLLDVDMPIVKEIHGYYDFIWIVILKGYGWFSEVTIRDFCEKNDIKYRLLFQNLKLKNPQIIFFHLKLLIFLKSLNADLIYDSYLGTPHLHLLSSFFLNKKKFVIAIHDVVQHYNMNHRAIRSLYYNFLMKRYDNIHLFSANQKKQFLTKYSGYKKNLLIAPLCLKDFGSMEELNNRNNDGEKVDFIFFGIIRENKGLDILIKAVNMLSKKYGKFSVTIAGKAADSYWNICENLIEDKSFYNLKIRTIDKNEVANLFRTARFLVLPYRDITQSGVLLTSYNYNVPVIASNLPGFEEYIENGKTGLLFEAMQTESLSAQMELAINMDDGKYSKMKYELSKFVEMKIRASSIAKKYAQYFDEVIESNK